MPQHYQVMVVGLGAMGSAAACALARRGVSVLGLDQFMPGHRHGSSHGHTRVIRQAYFEAPVYVPMMLRAYELWRQLERETGRSLVVECGGLMMGQADSEVVTGSQRSAVAHALPHDLLDARDLARRFPQFTLPPDTVALFEHRAGFVYCEAAVNAHLDRATDLGAELHFPETVSAWEPSGDGVRVRTNIGSYTADRLVLTAGPWAPDLLDRASVPLSVERQVLYWFDSALGIDSFVPGHFPVFIWAGAEGAIPYGLPAVDGPHGGIKVSVYRLPTATVCHPSTVDRSIHDDEVRAMRAAIGGILPAINGRLVRAETCLYTNTPDHDFVLAPLADLPQVLIACGFSGHGFKFAPVIGEIMADLALSGSARFDLEPFTPGRF